MPKAAARTATCRAMLPKPTRPSVRPTRRNSGLPGGTRPGAGAHQAVVERDLARAREQQRHRVLGDFLDAVGGVVGDDDAGARGGIEVDRVHADAVAGDDPALRHLRHHLGRDRAGIGVEQSVAIRRLREELLRLLGLQWARDQPAPPGSSSPRPAIPRRSRSTPLSPFQPCRFLSQKSDSLLG